MMKASHAAIRSKPRRQEGSSDDFVQRLKTASAYFGERGGNVAWDWALRLLGRDLPLFFDRRQVGANADRVGVQPPALLEDAREELRQKLDAISKRLEQDGSK